MDAITAGSGVLPAVEPGKFWPEPVNALVAGQANPGPAEGRTHTAHPAYSPSYAPAALAPPVSPGPGSGLGPGAVPPRRRGRWLLVAGGAGVAAAAIGGTLALALSAGSNGSTNQAGNTTPPSRPATTASSAAAASDSTSRSTPPAATSGAATSSSTAPPIVVTVCTEPADGCNYAGASQVMEATPSEISTAADGSGFVKNLLWSNWGNTRATATGMLEIDNCTPNCAQGTYAGYPATVTLSGLMPYGSGVEAYSTIVVQAPTGCGLAGS
jgi:hypothetical protein